MKSAASEFFGLPKENLKSEISQAERDFITEHPRCRQAVSLTMGSFTMGQPMFSRAPSLILTDR